MVLRGRIVGFTRVGSDIVFEIAVPASKVVSVPVNSEVELSSAEIIV